MAIGLLVIAIGVAMSLLIALTAGKRGVALVCASRGSPGSKLGVFELVRLGWV